MNRRFLIAVLLLWSLGPLMWQIYTSLSSDQALTQPFALADHRWTLVHYRNVLTDRKSVV